MKSKKINTFFDFWGVRIFFCRLGPRISPSARTPPKPSKSRFSRKSRVTSPNVVIARELRNATAVPMSQTIPENSPVAPSYGQNSFLVVGFPTDKTGLQPTKWPPAPPQKRQNPGPRETWDPKQGPVGPHLACNQIWSAGVSSGTAPKTGKIDLLAFFGPFRAPNGAANFL